MITPPIVIPPIAIPPIVTPPIITHPIVSPPTTFVPPLFLSTHCEDKFDAYEDSCLMPAVQLTRSKQKERDIILNPKRLDGRLLTKESVHKDINMEPCGDI